MSPQCRRNFETLLIDLDDTLYRNPLIPVTPNPAAALPAVARLTVPRPAVADAGEHSGCGLGWKFRHDMQEAT